MTIMLGDPVPWFFGARTVTGATIDLHVQAGRWVVLAFLGEAGDPQTGAELAALLGRAKLLGEQHLVLYLILPDARPDREMFGSISGEALGVIEDPDGALARQFGAAGAPRTIVLDPMLRPAMPPCWARSWPRCRRWRTPPASSCTRRCWWCRGCSSFRSATCWSISTRARAARNRASS
jgi:peroxiredoxin